MKRIVINHFRDFFRDGSENKETKMVINHFQDGSENKETKMVIKWKNGIQKMSDRHLSDRHFRVLRNMFRSTRKCLSDIEYVFHTSD